MILGKEAVLTALAYLQEFFPEEKDFQLEEIEYIDMARTWEVTFSMPDIKPSMAALSHVLAGSPRKYKILVIDADNRMVKSMKIRKL